MVVERSARPFARKLVCHRNEQTVRTFAAFHALRAEIETTRTNPEPSAPAHTSTRQYDPNEVYSSRDERRLRRRQGLSPIGSRRRRAVINSLKLRRVESLPFEEMPYQCFQEARKYLQDDRNAKVEQITLQRQRIESLRSRQTDAQDEATKEKKVTDMERRLSMLKVWADINDPVVKKRFEDGQGDMNKPIYRHLADQQWRSYKRKLLMQRIEQMNVVPDIIPAIDPVISSDLSFRSRNVLPGEFVDSRVSEFSPSLNIQTFEPGEKLITIAVVNPDVPNVQRDGFSFRGHFLASNIKISPTNGFIDFSRIHADKVLLDWHPAYAQKGAPYQRLAVVILEQPDGTIDTAKIKQTGKITERRKLEHEGFILRRMLDFYGLKPIGLTLFRTQWDEGTAGVMQRAGVPGWDVEFKRKRIEPLPYKKLPGSRYR